MLFQVITKELWSVKATYADVEAESIEQAINTVMEGTPETSHELLTVDSIAAQVVLDDKKTTVYSLLPITVLDCAKGRGAEVGGDSFSADEIYKVGLPFIGGCETCGATIACYNACPSRGGYLRCRDCIGDAGFHSTAAFEKWCKEEDTPADDSREETVYTNRVDVATESKP